MIKRITKTYENGLEHVHYHVPFLKTMSMCIYVKVGSSNEYKPVDYGISHFLEHMIFNGSKNYPDGAETRRILGSMGVMQNAWTFYSMTNYYLLSSKESMPKSLEILFDRVFRPLLNAEDIEKEKGIIQEERIMYENNHDYQLDQDVFEKAFDGTTYAHDVIGTKKSISEFTEVQIRDFHKTYYSPNNCKLVTYGGVDISEIEDCIYQNSEDLSSQDIPVHKVSTEGNLNEEKEIYIEKDTESTFYSAIIPITKSSSLKDLFSVFILKNILAGGNGSVLRNQLLVQNSHVSSYDFSAYLFRDISFVSFSSVMDLERAKDVKDVFVSSLDKVLNGVSKSEFERAKNYGYGSFIRSIESVDFPDGVGLTNIERVNFLNETQFEIGSSMEELKGLDQDYAEGWWKENIKSDQMIDGLLVPKN
jgi:predicted Zn-dependent peptidase